VREAGDCDLVLVGAAREEMLRRRLFGGPAKTVGARLDRQTVTPSACCSGLETVDRGPLTVDGVHFVRHAGPPAQVVFDRRAWSVERGPTAHGRRDRT
jgi:hypothetical protein